MSEYYQIAPCPQCGTDCWRRMGGHHGIKQYYACMSCGMDTNRIAAALKRAAEGMTDGRVM